MDPNHNLQEQLECVTEALSLRGDFDLELLDKEELHEIIATHLSLCDLVEAMNEWIRKGGFLPEVWQISQDDLSMEYFKGELSERFPWIREIQADGQPTADYEEPDGADVIQDLTELWSEIIRGVKIKPELVPLSLDERQMLVAMMNQYRDHIGDQGWGLEGFGEDDIYSGSFDIIRKLGSQPQPPVTAPVTPDSLPAEFMTDDGYKLVWDQVNRRWATTGGDVFYPAGWAWWPVDCFGEPLPGRLIK